MRGELKEGTHYQIVFYGGRLLSHIDATSPDNANSGISIFNTNRNAIMIIDSDKRSQQTRINNTKQRIKTEFNQMNAHCWITKGKEIENYIPSTVVDEIWNLTNSTQVGRYECFFDHLEKQVRKEGNKYRNKKPTLAEKLIPKMTKQNLEQILDLAEQMEKVCKNIYSWNS